MYDAFLIDLSVSSIRGTLGSIAPLSRNAGMLTSYVLGALLDYDQLPYVFIIIPIVYMINFIFLPNTPQYLVKRGEFEVYRHIMTTRGTNNLYIAMQQFSSFELLGS